MIMNTDKTKNSFRVSAKDFKKIPGSPIAYWVSHEVKDIFANVPALAKTAAPRQGLATTNNQLFLRFWYEISFPLIGIGLTRELAVVSKKKWFPINKGGSFRRWYGNFDYIINFENHGKTICNYIDNSPGVKVKSNGRIINRDKYFLPGLTWSTISSGPFSMRYTPEGFLFETKGAMCFCKNEEELLTLLGYMNTKIISIYLEAISPTLDFHEGPIGKIPFYTTSHFSTNEQSLVNLKRLVKSAKSDWDSYETSWDFQKNQLIKTRNQEEKNKTITLAETYYLLRLKWQQQTEEMRLLEIENNRIFIKAYGLQNELSPEVPWNEITLTCNPWYRYGKKPEDADSLGNSFYLNASAAQINPISKQEESCPDEDFPFAHDTEQRLLEDTIKEYISYAVGCMMGRYSPEKPGLILANQGESIDDYHKKMGNRDENITNGVLYSESTTNLAGTPYTIKERCGFSYHQIIDCDGVIPILDEEWFIDDIVAQFKSFLKFTFGMEHFADNLDFIEKALGKDIRKYFIKDFYKDHVQRYKKRPIYWMFSSPKGSFNALIYMHRYRPDTVSIVLNEYLREFISKIRSHREHLITENNRATLAPAEKTRNLKLIDKYAAMLTELDTYERDILYPLAQQKIAIDLDDGVKVNYCKFGAALKKIPGLEAKEE